MIRISRESNISVKVFILGMLMTFTGMLLWIWNLNTIRLGLIVVAELAYLSAGLIAIFFEKKHTKLSFLGKAALFFYSFFYFYCLLVNQFANGFHSDYIPNLFWDSGFFFIGFGCISFVGARAKELKLLVGSYIAFFILDLAVTGKYLNAAVAFTATDRRDAFRLISESLGHAHKAYQLHVILSSLALLMFAFVVEFVREKKWVFISLIGVLAMFFLGLFYQKRNVFVEAVLFAFFFIFLPSFKTTRRGLYFKVLGMIAVAGLVALYFVNDLFNSGINIVLNRFQNSGNRAAEGDGYSSNERIAETQFFLDQFESYYYFIGRGLTSFVPGAEGGNNLHLGAGNLILKGGYFMLLCFTILILLNVLVGIKRFFIHGEKMLLWLASFTLVSFYTYLAMWGWFPNIMYLPIALFLYDIYRNFEFE